MHCASDNTGPAHPSVIEALARANAGYATPYGNDEITARVTGAIRTLFEAPGAQVFLVPTGTAANSLALAAMAQPWQLVFASDVAHIYEDECGAVEFYSGGARIVPVPSTHGKITPEALNAAIAAGAPRGVMYGEPGALSLTNVTERGTVYTPDEIAALSATARAHGIGTHLDGARFANAVAALGCTPAEASWKAGVDALSFGATKNGCLGVEAVILFDTARARELPFRRKRAGHLFSKHRYLAAQMDGWLADGLWLDLARAANRAMGRLHAGIAKLPSAEIHHPVDANMMYVSLPRAAHRRAVAAGASYYLSLKDLEGGAEDDMIRVRLVTDWSAEDAATDRFLAHLTSG